MGYFRDKNSHLAYKGHLPSLRGEGGGGGGMSHPCRTKTRGGYIFSRDQLFAPQGCTLEVN